MSLELWLGDKGIPVPAQRAGFARRPAGLAQPNDAALQAAAQGMPGLRHDSEPDLARVAGMEE